MSYLETYFKLAALPEDLQKEADQFIDFLQTKAQKREEKPKPRKAGLAKGLIHMMPDFDEPLEDFKPYTT